MKDNLPVYLFHQGTNYKSYEYFGAHLQGGGAVFRVFAKNAAAVSVTGDFNNWNNYSHKMNRIDLDGVFEVFIPALKVYDNYKYCITDKKGKQTLKSDPFAFHGESDGGTASKIYDLSGYEWGDGEYVSNRQRADIYNKPINIYELHISSWRRYPDGSPFCFRKLAKELIPYLKKLNYTHVELMPVNEFPFEGSWGYQVTGYFAVTSRFGTPHDFMYFVDCCHINGISVIVDWVPAHFPKDESGLYKFDGGYLYEHQDDTRREHKGWGTVAFDWGRTQVQSFLISSAVFLFEKFHIDGLRVDAVASMLYLDYDKKPGEWSPNNLGGNKNLEAVAFLQKLNTAVFERFPYALMIAEESTAWGGVTLPVDKGGLGFNFKWNMGWMNDALSYMQTEPLFRKFCHNKLTFSLTYAFSENFILPISHDEVVHGKKSLLDKMPGNYFEKFANMRLFLGYMYSHPGKKLIFMGSEYGQFKEWAYKEGLEFFLVKYPMHRKMLSFVKALNSIYNSFPPLYENDYGWEGFDWNCVDEADKNVLCFTRYSKDDSITALFNFSGADLSGYRLGVDKGKYKLILNTDSPQYGGNGLLKKRVFNTQKISSHGKKHSIAVDIPPLTCLYLKKIF